MRKSLLPISALAGLAAAQNSTTNDTACAALAQSIPSMIANLTVYASEAYPDNTTFVDPVGFDQTNVTMGINAFCRFGATVQTSPNSSFVMEVWMPPADRWTNRFMMTGNGGDSGSVYYNAMATPMNVYNVAVANTNTGHFGDSGNGSFALNNPESQIDFGYRAVHLTTVYAKQVIQEYYGQAANYSYWYGCSSGGKQGQKEIQMFPDDFDGALTGVTPAQFWSGLNGFTQHINLVNGPNATAVVPPNTFPLLYAEVISQLDGVDGLEDGVITQPRVARNSLNLSTVACATLNSTFFNSTSCYNATVMETLMEIYTNFTSTNSSLSFPFLPGNESFIFPTFEVGSEFGWINTVNGRPYGPAPSYFLYQVLNQTELVLPYDFPPFYPSNDELQGLIYESLQTDPGMTNAFTTPTEYMQKGGKWIQYHGWADPLIPSGSSLMYRAHILGDVDEATLNQSARFYMVPGFSHCAGGPGAGALNFGGASQKLNANGTGQSLQMDPKYDMVLALIDWVENGNAPDEITAVKYVQNDKRLGVDLTRKLCPYPSYAQYTGTNSSSADSFTCV